MQKNQGFFRQVYNQGNKVLDLLDRILDYIEGTHIERRENNYIIDCEKCLMCTTRNECFYEAFLETILTTINYETQIFINEAKNKKQLTFRKIDEI